MSALSELLNSQPISARRAADIAEDQNIHLPYGTIAAYWSGKHGRPSAATLTRLSLVLNMPLKDLQQAAWNASAPLGMWQPPEEAALLDQRQRDVLDELIKSIVATRGATNGMEDATQSDAPSEANKIEEGKPAPLNESNQGAGVVSLDKSKVPRERGRRAGPDAAARARAKRPQDGRQQG